jgi:hypothetical protein
VPQLIRIRRRRGDRGAVATLVAVLLAGNVLVGMGALVVDVGLLYAEREDLQSGADAGALAVAKACAASHWTCNPGQATGLAVSYADDNADDGESQAAVCGRVLSGGAPVNRLSPCAPGASNLTGCIGSAPVDPAPYVEVRTRTLRDDGSTLLPYAFASTLTGTDGARLGACSRVTWGPVRRAASSVAMAISMCDFLAATNQGAEFQPPPDAGVADPDTDVAAEVALRWRPASNTLCTFGGNSFPAGFNWIPTGAPGGTCSRTVTVGNWFTAPVTPGSPSNCANLMHNAYHSLTPVSVAIIDDSRAISPGVWQLRVAGIAVFVITGWRRPTFGTWPGGPDHDHAPALHGTNFCPAAGAFCVYGYFTTRVMRLTSTTPIGPLGARHFGAVYLRTVG